MLGMREHRHYPNFEFFKIAARHNCDIILGCDAHEPKDVCDLESAKTALEWCRELGLNRIEYPELKKPCRKQNDQNKKSLSMNCAKQYVIH